MKTKSESLHLMTLFKEFVTIRAYMLFCIGSVVLMILTYFCFFNEGDLLVFPGKKRTIFYTDQNNEGNSIVDHSFHNDSLIHFEFTLRKGFVVPYAGLNISLSHENFKNVSAYNRIHIQLKTQNIPDLIVYLITKDKMVKDTNQLLAYRHIGGNIETTDGLHDFHLTFKEFATPDWWFTSIKQPKSDFGSPDWSQLQQIAIVTGINPRLDNKSTVEISKIVFYRDNTDVLLTMALFEMLFVMGLFTWFYVQKRNKRPKISIDIEYKAVHVSESKKSGYSFLDYIHQNFMNSELGLEEISKQCGVAPRYISDTISEKFNCNFKTYINQIRVNECKRLLKETDLNINEIAYKVGFSSPGSLNRVFKTFTGLTPSEYKQNPVS